MMVLQVYLNEGLHYPNGFTVSLSPMMKWYSLNSKRNTLIFTHPADLPEFTKLTIVIKPK